MRFARVSRAAMAVALLLSMGAGLIGFAPAALAQTSSTHDLAKAAPDDTLLYVDLSLDTKSPQWTKAIALIEAINGPSTDSVTSMAADDGIDGGEGALVITNLNAVTSAADTASSAVS